MDLWSILGGAAERWPTRVGVVDGASRRTWGESAARARGLAAGLAGLGVRPTDRVAILERNSAAYLESYFAAAAAGAVLVPLNVRLAPRELAAILEDCSPKAWLVRADLAPLARDVRAAAGSLPTTVWIGEGPDGVRYEDLASGGGSGFEPADVTPEGLAQLYYTSGTTGAPKGVMLTHGNVCAHAQAATSELDLAEDDVWGHVAPLFHLADAWATFAVTLVGGTHVVAPRFDAAEVLALMQRERVTITNVVPTMLLRMLAAAGEVGFDARHLRTLLTGGAPIAPETVRQVVERFGCEYVQTYGMTETSPYLTLSRLRQHHYALPREEQLRIAARTGRPFETVDLEVVDEGGRPVPLDDSTPGEIRVRGATVSPGYWHRPEETAAAFREGWLYTGDLAVVDAEGYVNIVDRKKDMILTGGESVSSIEVENALYEHPAVLEAAAFGVPHPEWGEELRAAVALSRPVEPAELIEFCRGRLAGYKCPRRVDVLDALPKTGSGKIRKAALRAAARGG